MSVFYFTPPPPFNEWGAENERVSGPVRKLPSTVHLELSPASPEKTLWMNRCAPNSKLGPNHKQETRDTTKRHIRLNLASEIESAVKMCCHCPWTWEGHFPEGSASLSVELQEDWIPAPSGWHLFCRVPGALLETISDTDVPHLWKAHRFPHYWRKHPRIASLIYTAAYVLGTSQVRDLVSSALSRQLK